jgi:hypothetical protein
MRTLLHVRRFCARRPLILGVAVAVAGLMSAVPASAIASAPAHVQAPGVKPIKPNKLGELDCNGYSPIQMSVKRTMVCTDLHGSKADGGRVYDNGHYIGHDEPDLRFLSSRPGSGNNVTWTETLGSDPAAAPTVTSPGHDVTHYAELTIAPWFSMQMCDPQSYPLNPCTPQSDANAPGPACIGANPCTQADAGAGSAFMELQFYPPGQAPFADNISCDNTHWCAALTIDSFEATLNFATINPNCTEPVNFAFIQTNGVPAGPPSPQLSDLQTMTPNANTLLMNPGDKVTVHMSDAKLPGGGGSAFEAFITDNTTGQTGFMQASAANGFMNTNVSTCAGTPFNFEPEYSTDAAANISGWTALAVNISTQFEIGHFEPCSNVTSPATNVLAPGVTDTYDRHCVGAYEDTTARDGGKNPEASDAPCYPQGDTHGGLAPPNVVTGCVETFTQNGDLDFDGTPYWADWPNSTTPDTFPSTFLQSAPTTVGGANYPQFQFQTDAALSESTCTGPAGGGCTVPPPNAPGAFYPFWTSSSACTWEFGNMTNGNTFGEQAQYGADQFATLAYPEFESGFLANPCR